MDFFEAQDQARRSTKKLILLFIVACICVVIGVNAVALGVIAVINHNRGDIQALRDITSNTPGQSIRVDHDHTLWRWDILGIVSLGTLVVIGGGSLYKTAQLHGDGGKVARLLGGRILDSQSKDEHEQKLLNIVEEMSIASGVPVPDVYVMDDQMGINAFAAGNDIDTAVVGVTRGCMEKLTRDELQGVIAHEFSHILNGDMKLNLRLIGVIFGLLVIGLIGYSLFRFAPYMNTRSRDNKGGGAAFMLLLIAAGIAIWIIGSIGVFFGRLIQASVSRQREFLADASAVQFTRNPNGIRDALRRIGGHSFGSDVKALHAGEVSHMFFADGFTSLFATHPPLPKRIEALDPRWDGTFLKENAKPTRKDQRPDRQQSRSRRQEGVASIPVLGDIFGGGQHTRTGNNLISNFLGAPA
ncbi:MAG: M48 family metallopeptidase, partial [Planctomycetota bacterium]